MLRLRVQKVNDDICGVEGAKDGGMHKIGKHEVWLGYLDGTQIAQWGDSGFTYCLIGEGFGSFGKEPPRGGSGARRAGRNAERTAVKTVEMKNRFSEAVFI